MAKTLKVMFEALFPEGAAWHPEIDGDFDHFLDGLGDNAEHVRAYLEDLANVRSPARTTDIDDLEIEHGIVPDANISEANRRTYLGEKKHGLIGTGSAGSGDDPAGNIQNRLQAAGFNVYVYENDPPIDPVTLLGNDPNALCNFPTSVCGQAAAFCGGGGYETLVNSSLSDNPYVYIAPTEPTRWPFVYFIGGARTGWISLDDWNMEKSHTLDWPAKEGAVVKKSMVTKHTGLRSLEIIASSVDTDAQRQQPANPDADLQSFYRMDDVGAGVVENLAWKNELADGNMEKPGPDVIVDGDMEVTGPDVIVDGDMEVTGPDVIVDGDMEAVGIGAWIVGAGAVVTKQGSAHGGAQCLRVFRTGANSYAAQNILTIGKTYRVHGWARSDGTVTPVIVCGLQVWGGNTSTSWQEFDVVFVATANLLQFLANVTGFYSEWDDITVIDETVACAAWTVGGSALLSKQGDAYEAAQCLRVEYGGGVINPTAQQAVLTPGKTYRLKGWARGDGTAYPHAYIGGAIVWTGTSSTSWQYFDVVRVATNTVVRFYTVTAVAGYCEFDDVEVIDETVSCAAWIVGNAALLSKQGDAYEGAQCIRVEYDGTPQPSAIQVICVIGKTYRIKGWARGDGSNAPYIRVSGTGNIWVGTSSTSWQSFDLIHLAAGVNFYLFSNMIAAGYVEFDDVFIIDLDAGASDYTTIGTVTATKRQDPYDGQRCLRVTNGAGIGIVKPTVDVLVIGNDFNITGYARGSGTAKPRLRDGAGAYIWTGTTSTAWQEIDITITATAVDLRFMVDLINDYSEFDQMLVNAIPGAVHTLGTDASNANGVNVTTPWIEGIEFVPGAAAVLDGGAVNLAMSMENMTMLGWFYLEDYATPGIQGLITNGGVGVTRQGLHIDSGFIRYSCVSGAAKIIQTAVTLPYQQRWRMRIGVTRTWDGMTMTEKLFVNGVLKDSLTFRGAPDVTLTQLWIGWLNGVNYFNGIGSDNVSLFNSGKSDAYMLADYEDGIDAMLSGPHVEQILPVPETAESPLTGYAWSDWVNGTPSLPFVYVLDTTSGEWRPYWLGDTTVTIQTIVDTLDNIGGIRLYCKNVLDGQVSFDDLRIDNPNIVPANVPANQELTFKKIILENKPLRSWAGLIVKYV